MTTLIFKLDAALESQLQETTQRLVLYADLVKNLSLPVNIFQLLDPADPRSLTLITSNPAAADELGIDIQRSIGKSICEVFPKIQETLLERHAQIAQQLIPNQHYNTIYEDDQVIGGLFEVRLFSLPDRCLGVAFENITERAQLEKQVKESKARLRTAFDKAAIGMARMSVDGYWIEVNHVLCGILGYTPDELQQLTFKDITPESEHPQDDMYYNQLIAGEIESCAFEKQYRHSQGTLFWANVTVSALRKRDGSICDFIVTIEDIERRKQAELVLQERAIELRRLNRQLAQSRRTLTRRNEELQHFSYAVSHDLKAPLRAIASLSEWLEEDLSGDLPEESQKHLQLIRQRAERMARLLDGLLDYSRVGCKQTHLEMVVVRSLLDEVIDSLGVTCKLQLDIVGEMPTLETRKISLSQVFSNLIGNGIKHCNRDDCHLTIAVKEQKDFYEFSVQDNGPGIDSAHHDRIFNIFQTLQDRDQGENSGIGLAIVKKILDLEGGEIWIESELGQGAKFVFTWQKVSIVVEVELS